jgi:hypothetical protein
MFFSFVLAENGNEQYRGLYQTTQEQHKHSGLYQKNKMSDSNAANIPRFCSFPLFSPRTTATNNIVGCIKQHKSNIKTFWFVSKEQNNGGSYPHIASSYHCGSCACRI